MIGNVDIAGVREAVKRDGYFIAKSLVPEATVREIREFWLAEYAKEQPEQVLIWTPYYGEPSGILFDRSQTHRLFRSYDYLWNPPQHALTRELALSLSRLRNRVIETDERDGETFAVDHFATYVTTTYYPPDGGWLHQHIDDVPGHLHWHFQVPLTFRGTDYASGGLYYFDRAGNRVDVDGAVAPGDVLFFDATQPHGVDPIGPLAQGDAIGRMQMFAIPTLMEMPHENDRVIDHLSWTRILKAKIRPLKWKLLGRPDRRYGE